MSKDFLKATGRVEVILTKGDGSIEREVFDNLVVTVGKAHIAARLGASPPAAMSHIAIGTGATGPVVGDTALQTELDRNAATPTPSANTIAYAATWLPGDGTGAITEAGIFNAASAGVMLSRVTFPVKNKDAADTFAINWTITIN